MGILSATKRVGSVFFNFRVDKWIDYEYLKSLTLFFVNQFQFVFRLAKPRPPETFEEAIYRLELSPQELILRSKQYLILCYFFLGNSLALTCYSYYLYSIESFMGSIMTASITIYSITYAFRYHYWNYQIRRLRLGCTFKEWFRDLFVLGFHARLLPQHLQYNTLFYEETPAIESKPEIEVADNDDTGNKAEATDNGPRNES